MSSKLDRFTPAARAALSAAQTEANNLNHNYIGTEHLLLALVSASEYSVGQILDDLEISEQMVRDCVNTHVGKGQRKPFGKPTLVPRMKKVIELAVDTARLLDHHMIDTQHLLMGIVKEGQGAAASILDQFAPLASIEAKIIVTILGDESASFNPSLQLAMSKLIDDDVDDKDIKNLKSIRRYIPSDLLFKVLRGLHSSREKNISATAAQEERKRIARDLHDSIKQQLFNINISAATVRERWESDPDGARSALNDVQESAKAAMVEMNAMLKQLSPNPLEKTGLVEALREQCQALAFRTGAQVNTAFGEIPFEELLPLGTQVAIFRIAQEALANIARHARANQVRLRLETYPVEQMLALEIIDDGQGFEHKKIPVGMGMTNMQERTERLNGTLEIHSEPGKGTMIRVEIPFLEPTTE
ncbi:MAG: Clp protease N-terminal domain-containing protein [Chloroflexota bacterium]